MRRLSRSGVQDQLSLSSWSLNVFRRWAVSSLLWVDSITSVNWSIRSTTMRSHASLEPLEFPGKVSEGLNWPIKWTRPILKGPAVFQANSFCRFLHRCAEQILPSKRSQRKGDTTDLCSTKTWSGLHPYADITNTSFATIESSSKLAAISIVLVFRGFEESSRSEWRGDSASEFNSDSRKNLGETQQALRLRYVRHHQFPHQKWNRVSRHQLQTSLWEKWAEIRKADDLLLLLRMKIRREKGEKDRGGGRKSKRYQY